MTVGLSNCIEKNSDWELLIKMITLGPIDCDENVVVGSCLNDAGTRLTIKFSCCVH